MHWVGHRMAAASVNASSGVLPTRVITQAVAAIAPIRLLQQGLVALVQGTVPTPNRWLENVDENGAGGTAT